MPSDQDAFDKIEQWVRSAAKFVQETAVESLRRVVDEASGRQYVPPEDRLVTEVWIPVWESLNVLAKYDALEEAEDAIRTWESRPNPPKPFIGIIHICPDSTLEWVEYES